MIAEFRKWLIKQNLSENTVNSYTFTVEHYFSIYKEITKENLLTYKGFLVETYKGKTVNLRIQGLNKYLEYIGQTSDRLKFVKIQQKNFLENVISNADYVFFKNQLKKDKNMDWYFVVRFLGATGARVSELIEIKVEHVKAGHIDIYSKGGKIRRLYIAKFTTRGIAHQLKKLASDYKMNIDVVYPHSFRHRFAKNFLEKYSDIALLADLMGHESIETTRIYLRRTSEEQRELIDKIITW